MRNSAAPVFVFLLTLFVATVLEHTHGWIATANAQGNIALEPVVTGLTRADGITHAGDGSGRLFIISRMDESSSIMAFNFYRRLFSIFPRWCRVAASKDSSAWRFIPAIPAMASFM